MAFIVSKLARAAFASRPVGDIAGGISPCLPGLYLTGGSIRRMSAAADGSEIEEILGLRGFAADINLEEKFPLVDENSIKSKESLWALYKCWCKYRGVSRDHEEMTRRFSSFRASAMRVYKNNNSRSSQVSQLGPFADMTKAEIARLFPPRGPKCRFGGSRRQCRP
ncbi:cysteine proteinase EP-B 1-like [Triticum dicoccoides]|uniref:cysteine proteinase EP-B 1-like n=1 Tax=Triticum dicoccoides TaxID=85692 RepID=UPI000E7CEB82|nr:cysteine proteinase EP-B 1-like [Triticum dicoccoides]